MSDNLQQQFHEEIVELLDESEGATVAEDEVESLLQESVDIDYPEVQLDRIEYMTGSSLHETKRREPISVRLNLREASLGASSLVSGFLIPNSLGMGFVLLSTISAIVLRNTERIKPNQALTYGIGWNLTDQGEVFAEKDYLIEEVIDASHDIDVLTDMSENDVEQAIQELLQMRCIDADEVDEGVLIWFNEHFDVEYSVR